MCLMAKFEVNIASVPDKQELVVEIWNGPYQIAEINFEGGTEKIEIYPLSSGQPLSVDLKDFLIALQEARKKLATL